jgi:hypothetical protein
MAFAVHWSAVVPLSESDHLGRVGSTPDRRAESGGAEQMGAAVALTSLLLFVVFVAVVVCSAAVAAQLV